MVTEGGTVCHSPSGDSSVRRKPGGGAGRVVVFVPIGECYKVWPTNNWNASVKVPVTFNEATDFCATQSAVIPVPLNASQVTFMLNLMGPTSGMTVWLGIRANPAKLEPPQQWMTITNHIFTEFFMWDSAQNMPGPESCAALQAAGDISRRIPGGNDKMITLDCFQRVSVICAKQSVPVGINGVNLTNAAVLQVVWGESLSLSFIGSRIPQGTAVTLQTTDEYLFNGPPRQPTMCRPITPLIGAATPVTLNVTTDTLANSLCNGTCQIATAYWPPTTPFIQGAQYSICFFVPIPFAHFDNPQEFGQNLLPNVVVEFTLPRPMYLRDVCRRYEANVNLFTGGANAVGAGPPSTRPYFFDTPVGP